jgi:aerobic-type carbon monoxide dehydrogenase small subunit (CoxS/CutS family)
MSDDENRPGFTRRDLVRSALVGAVAAKVGAKTPAQADRAMGPGAVPMTLNVNGHAYRLNAEPRVVLADALRERLGLTGTKVVCGRGACGACTVMVDGETACSCLLLAAEVQGRKITTIEGLSADGRLAPIQEAFVEADALQCGFCTSGMVMSCKSLLDRNPKPSRDEIKHAVAGNLCRCGTYPHVIDAVERAAGIRTAERAERPSFTVAGFASSVAPAGVLHSDDRIEAGTAEALDLEEA